MKNELSESLLKRAQEIGEQIKIIETLDLEQAYRGTWGKIHHNRIKYFRTLFQKLAAILALPLLLFSFAMSYLYFHKSEVDIKYAQVKAAQGTVVRYELPDKTVVWLNSGSSLRYPTTFNDGKRSVYLEGEAYFHVTADKKHPFYVNTSSQLSVYVYGTHFNVSAYRDDDCVETVLEEGKVNVITPDKQNLVKLIPGERFLYNKKTNRTSKNMVDIYEKTAWKDGKLIFRNTPLEEVFKRLARHFNIDIRLKNLSGKDYKYRATFTQENFNQILDYLSKSASLKWKLEEPVQQKDDTFTQKKIIVTLY